MTISLHVISNGLYNVYCVAILIKNQQSIPFLFRSKSLAGNSTGEQKKNRKEVNSIECTIVHLLTFKVMPCQHSLYLFGRIQNKPNDMSSNLSIKWMFGHVLGLISQTIFEYDPSSTLSWAGVVLGPIFEWCSSEQPFKVWSNFS